MKRQQAPRRGAIVAIIPLLLAAGGCAAKPAIPSPVGHWFGNGYHADLDEHTRWLSHAGADGAYAATIQFVRDCNIVGVQKERGTWSVDDDVLHIVTTTIDDVPAPDGESYYDEEYVIAPRADGSVELRHVGTDAAFHLVRVGEGALFPATATIPGCS